MSKIAFLGLGAMGSRMAANLIKAGFDVTVWNRTAARADALVSQGAKLGVTPASAAKGADFVISMLTDDNAAREVWLGANGALSAMSKSAIAIEVSTVSPAWVYELGGAATKSGVHLLDAPVAGSRPQAEAGQLIFMVGGEAAELETANPVLAPLAANIIHAGPLGQGAILKLAVNAFFALQLAGMAELLGFLSKNGFTAENAANLMAQFPVVAAPLAGSAKIMAAGNTTPMFTIDLIAKDLGYALNIAGLGQAPVIAATKMVAEKAIANGHGAANVSGFAKLYL